MARVAHIPDAFVTQVADVAEHILPRDQVKVALGSEEEDCLM
jgi:hypothetical protein